MALFFGVNGEARQNDDGDRTVRLASADSLRRFVLRDRARREGVVANDSVVAMHEIDSRTLVPVTGEGETPQPVREFRFPTVELVDDVRCGDRLDT
jgi:hypothetical protein